MGPHPGRRQSGPDKPRAGTARRGCIGRRGPENGRCQAGRRRFSPPGARRAIPHYRTDRARRHGCGLQGRARQWGFYTGRRHQDHSAGRSQRQPDCAVRARTPDPGRSRTSKHCSPVRWRRASGWLALYRHGICRWRADHRLGAIGGTVSGRPPAAVPGCLRRGAACSPEPDRASRHHTIQCARDESRHRQADRFRHRPAAIR